jgi:hypothetical protein
MLAIIENAGGDLEQATEAEQRLIEAMRQRAMKGCTAGHGVSSRKRKTSTTPNWV